MKRVFIALILVSLLLSGCGTFEIYVETTPEGNSNIPGGAVATAERKLSIKSTSEEIQRAMLESATKWKSIWMDGTVTQYAMPQTDSQTTTTREQVWIDLTMNRFRIVSGPVDGEAETFKSSDGISIWDMDLKSGESQVYPMAPMPEEKQFVPTLQPGFGFPQPLWGQIGTPLSQLAFPSDFAQNEGTFKPTGTEIIAGREALIVEWTFAQSELPSFRMWLDTKTAVILKMQNFDKGGGDTIRSEVAVEQVRFDDVFASSLFGAPATMPKFSDMTGKPLHPQPELPTASTDPDPLGNVYFFVFDHNYGNEKTQLMRLPGSCVAGLIACPQADEIAVPSDLNFSLTPLVWSPKANEAAFSFTGSREGEKTRLSLYTPEEQTWNTLAEFNFIDPPLWSPDGEWLAFRVQDGLGKDEVYLVRNDGTELTNLSENEKLPEEGQPYILNGWISNQVILRGRNGEVVLLRAEDGRVQQLFDTPLSKYVFVPSPDGYFVAYFDVIDARATLALLTPDGKTGRDLASFEHASLYPIVWSPDGTQLAFAKMTQDLSMGQDVYIINSDGQNLQQVYHSNSAAIASIIFSPDGKYLLFQDDDATGRHLFTVDLATLENHMLQVPDVPLDWWILAPSWQR